MYLLQREQRRVMQADQAVMDILSKVMPYKVSTSTSDPRWPCLDNPHCLSLRATTQEPVDRRCPGMLALAVENDQV